MKIYISEKLGNTSLHSLHWWSNRFITICCLKAVSCICSSIYITLMVTSTFCFKPTVTPCLKKITAWSIFLFDMLTQILEKCSFLPLCFLLFPNKHTSPIFLKVFLSFRKLELYFGVWRIDQIGTIHLGALRLTVGMKW